ncbi:MAG: serine kinase [Rhodobacteraceae bacterium]|nr:serine kinase [Paracoccaceae bacterium]
MTIDELAASRQLVHATCIGFPTPCSEAWPQVPPPIAPAVLIIGPSGAGKSSLGLRLLALGGGLVADDQTQLSAFPNAETPTQIHATAPTSIAGLIEARGVGLLRVSPLPDARVCWVVELSLETDAPPMQRLPKKRLINIFGVDLPLLPLQNTSRAAAILQVLAAGAALVDPDIDSPPEMTEIEG